ncbi:hypothetical protein AJ80_04304 [Polytolypa hystricis UAMH7299]|uniref:THUMP domain-containing protein n=1 Tax=Polytolypa hystricis (strain UAMH7299) TaxID=1447883 RepID=A0A2B7YBH1_POLH7|nr:hypothetical protein AJ80_04304 [Polytolypa hystricis UAMH7299]
MAENTSNQASKKQKRHNPWKQQNVFVKSRRFIDSGESGIFVTCERGRESKALSELIDLLSQDLEARTPAAEDVDDSAASEDEDIEAQIKKEVEGMKPAARPKAPFQPIKFDKIMCLSFVKTRKDIDPVEVVHRLCADAQANPGKKRSRWIQRLTPVSLTRKHLGDGVEELAREVLKPHFHTGSPPKKYAIRPTIRNNTEWHKDSIIKLVASVVGPRHSVDLKNYDALILVDVLQNICGMSVVGPDYEELKRYNLAEIYNPTPKPSTSHEPPKGADVDPKPTEPSPAE